MTDETQPGADARHNVTALFDTRQDAEKARADLIAAGIPADAVRFVHGPEAANAAVPQHDQGFLKSLLDIFVFMPRYDRSSYAEALRRGGSALAVHVPRESYERVVDILDRDGAVDLDERETVWKAEGWSGEGSPAEPAPAAGSFDAVQGHDPLVNPDATRDVRERIGVGTSDQTVGIDLAPGNAATEPAPTVIPGEDEQSVTSVRDTEHGRRRVRGYVPSAGGIPTGIDPAI